MDKNLLYAVGLSFLVYAVWFGVVEKKVAPPPGRAAHPTASGSALPSGAAPTGQQPQPQQQQPAPAPSSAVQQQPSAEMTTEQRAKLEKQAVAAALGGAKVRISPKGAAVVSWQYQEPLGTVELVRDPQPGFLATFPELTFSPDKADPLTWRARRADGLSVVKRFVPAPDEKTLPQVEVTLVDEAKKPVQTGPWSISVGPGLGTILSEEKENPKVTRAIGLTPGQGALAGKVETFKPGEHPGAFRWVAVDNRYFLAALLPKAEDFPTVTSQQPPMIDAGAASATLQPGQSRTWAVPFYVGEKGSTFLRRYKVGLERSINFGFFSQLGRFMLDILFKVHNVVGNWGWSIIILTVAIQIVLLPLTMKSFKAQAAMRKLQPEITRLQQRYKSDPQRLNAETMELYKKHGANPLGGCLPMLLQMPIFYALYYALRNAWELHGAPWIFWIKDLSVKDPYYVLPIVMGVLMWAQNKLNPQTSDPTQQQMMMWMPIIFTFMFLKFPAGLVLYWLTNSAANAAVQLALRKRFT